MISYRWGRGTLGVLVASLVALAACTGPSSLGGDGDAISARDERVKGAFGDFGRAIAEKEASQASVAYQLGDEARLTDGTSVTLWVFADDVLATVRTRCVWIDVIQPGDSGEGSGSCGLADENLTVTRDLGVVVGFVGSSPARSARIQDAVNVEATVTGGYFLITAPELVKAESWARVELLDQADRTISAIGNLKVPGSAAL